MAFPDDYEENTSRCMGKYQDHTWATMGHPLRHRCLTCHQLRWKEIKVPTEIPIGYVPAIVWGGKL